MRHKISECLYSASNIEINDFIYIKYHLFHNHMEHTVNKEANMVMLLHR